MTKADRNDSSKPMRLAAGRYNVRPEWNAAGDTLGFLTGFQIMGQERRRDLIVWHAGDPPQKLERITEGRTLEFFDFSPDSRWVSYQELQALKQEYEWGVIRLDSKQMTPLFRGTDTRGGGVWSTDGRSVAFGGDVFSMNDGQWKPSGKLDIPCAQPRTVPAGEDGFLLACISDEGDLQRWQAGHWTPLHVEDGTTNYLGYFPEEGKYIVVLVRAWKNEAAQYTLYWLGKNLNTEMTLRNYEHPVIIFGLSRGRLYFSEKQNIETPEYDLEVTYQAANKVRKEVDSDRRIWDVRGGHILYTPLSSDGEIWEENADGSRHKLKDTGRIGTVSFSADGRRLAFSARRDARLPDSDIWVLNLEK